MQTASWIPIHTILLASLPLALFGLIGLYRRQTEDGSALGLSGFVLTFIGLSLTIGVLTVDAYVVPAIAADASSQALLDPIGGPLMGFSGLLLHLAATAGGILMGASFVWLGYAVWSDRSQAAAIAPMMAKA